MSNFELVFNELSLEQPSTTIEEARYRMSHFIQTIAAATGKKYKLKLVIEDAEFYDRQLAPGYSVTRWFNDKELSQTQKEQKNLFMKFVSNRPDLIGCNDDRELFMNCSWQCNQAIGLCKALSLDTIAISVPSAPWDNVSYVQVLVKELSDDGDWLPDRLANVLHVSSPEHLEEHAEWIELRLKAEKNQRLQQIQTGDDVWTKRSLFHPALEFCAGVEQQLHHHNPQREHIKAIRLRLYYLQQYCQQWISGRFDYKKLAGNASPESEATLENKEYKQKRTFLCPDGQERLFRWHLKMHDGWRLHFYPDEERRKIIVGYIGPHLPTVKYHN